MSRMMCCMLPLGATGPLGDWLSSLPATGSGNDSDKVNVLVKRIPPGDVLSAADRVIQLPFATPVETDEYDHPLSSGRVDMVQAWVSLIGAELFRGGNVLILGDIGQFQAAYNTPYWRLWCGRYSPDEMEQFEEDKRAVGLPAEMTVADSRETIAAKFATPI